MAKKTKTVYIREHKTEFKPGTFFGGLAMDIVLWLFSLISIFPIVWMIYNSLKKKTVFNADKLSIPGLFGAEKPTIQNYIDILSNKDYHLGQSMLNSVITTGISILAIVIFSFIVGYILARIKGKWNRPLYLMFLSGMLIPIHALLVPIYVSFSSLNLNDKWYTLLMPYISFGLPMGIFLMEGYVKGIPASMEEAASIDGCSFSGTLWQIIMPMCKPILVTIAIIQVFSCWNEFSFALVLIDSQRWFTVPLALTQFKGQFGSDYPKQMAAMLITMSPIIILYFIFAKQIIKGMVAGAVKG